MKVTISGWSIKDVSPPPIWDGQADPVTRADADRHRAQGKTNREIKRCLVPRRRPPALRLLKTQPALDATYR
jgi:hypothetical protein